MNEKNSSENSHQFSTGNYNFESKKVESKLNTPLLGIFKILFMTLAYYVFFHGIFYGIEQVHYYYCTPSGAIGFLQSMFTSRSQMCVYLRNASWYTSNASANMLTLLGLTFMNLFNNVQHKVGAK